MTAQIAERLHYEGRDYAMCAEPLGRYFALGGHWPAFDTDYCTALWRGYVGSWEIHHDRLYLIGLTGTLEDGREATLATVFPAYPERVFAHWYSGTLRLPQGKQLEYVHMGYESVFEQDLLLTLADGVVTGKELRRNGVATDPAAPDSYGPGALTIFPPDHGRDGSP